MTFSSLIAQARRLLYAPVAIAQIIWALPQAFLVVLLAHRGSVELLGVVVLALSIYTPLALILGLNLRNELAVDEARRLDVRGALMLRAITATGAALLTLAAILPWHRQEEAEWIVAAVLASRLVDQMSDIGVGAYQRRGTQSRIAASLAARGLAQGLPMALCLAGAIPLMTGFLLAFLASALAALLIDWWPLCRQTDPLPARRRIAQLWGQLRPRLLSTPFPALDALYANMSRYGAGMLLPLAVVGHIGLGFAIYTPLGIFISAIGYTHLASTVQARDAGDGPEIRRSLLASMGLALLAAAGVLVATALAPPALLAMLGAQVESGGRTILVLTIASLIPQAMVGFACQTMIALGRRRAYLLNPVLGIAAFMLLASLALLLVDKMTVSLLMTSLFVAGVVRLAHSLWHVRQAIAHRETLS